MQIELRQRTNYIWKNILLFIVGACLYAGIELLWRGVSYRLMMLVGGCALVVCDKVNDNLSWDIPLLWQMMIGGLIITAMELISGEFALNIMGTRMWDYSNQWMSMCDDLICPLFSLFWVMLSGVGIILADAINFYVLHENQRPYYRHLNGNMWFYLPKRICGGEE